MHSLILAAALLTPIQDAPTPPAPNPPEVVVANVGFLGPEAARYDSVRDEYIVSNLGPAGDGNDGFVSRVAPDGTVIELKWIAGGVKGTFLTNPLGVFLHGETLYITDVKAVRTFDRRTGAMRSSYEIPDAVRLNDLVVASDGTIYVTDSGSAERDGAIFKISPAGEVTPFVSRSAALERPNGIALTADGNVVHGGRGVNLVFRDRAGAILREQSLPTGQIDGIVLMPGGDLLVASQLGKNVYRVPADGSAPKAVAENIAVPAAIGLDTKRGRLLVPQIRAASLSLFPVDD
jgi:sugar lactone lactonase YvrE